MTLTVFAYFLLGAVMMPPNLPAAPPPREAPPAAPPKWQFHSPAGEVTAVDDRSITVRGFSFRRSGVTANWASDLLCTEMVESGNPVVVEFPDQTLLCNRFHITRTRLTLTLLTGEDMPIRREDQPARRFPVDPASPAGGFRAEADRSYRLADVRVGDEVSLSNKLVDGVWVCREILIRRRPGGRVPPMPGEGPNPRAGPYHERMNAYQDYEDFGTPLPAKYDPAVGAAEARAMQQWLDQKRAAEERTAPEPREVTAKPKP